MLRRLSIFALILGALASLAVAQTLREFADALDTTLMNEDLAAAAEIVVNYPQMGLQYAAQVEASWDSMDQQEQVFRLYAVNVIARVLELRRGDRSLSQELSRRGYLLGEEHWAGTPLARGFTPAQSTSPSAGQPSVQAVAELFVRLGSYPSVLAFSKSVFNESQPDPQLTRLLKRYQAIALMELSLFNQALSECDQLLKQSATSKERLATELVALMSARYGRYPTKVREYLKAAEATLPTVKDDYGNVAAYILESVRFELDLEQNPRMPLETIKKRHDQAMQRVRKMASQGDLKDCSAELKWVATIMWDSWVANVVDLGEGGKKLAESFVEPDIQIYGQLAQRLAAAERVDPLLGLMMLAERYCMKAQEDEDYAEARTTLVDLEPCVSQLEASLKTYDASLQQLGVNLSFADGEPSAHKAMYHLLLATQVGEEKNSARPEELVGKMDRELGEALDASIKSYNVELISQILFGRLLLRLAAQTAGYIEDCEQGLQLITQLPGAMEQRSTQAYYHYIQGRVLAAKGQKDQAITHYQKAVDVAEQYIRETGANEEAAQHIRNEVVMFYNELAKAQLERGQNGEAFSTIGRMQQMQTTEAIQAQDLFPKLKPEDRAKAEKARQLRGELEAQEKELVGLKQTKASADKIQRATELLAQSREAYYKTVTDLEDKYPAFQKLDIKPLNFSKLQRAIPADTLVVLLFPADDKLYLMEATTDKLTVRQVDIKRSELDALGTEFRQQVVLYSRNPGAFSWKSPEAQALKKNLAQLYDTIVKPIEPDMQGKEAIAFVPYGSLVYLPFQAFLTENPDGTVTFLVEKKQIAVLSKATDLDQIYGPPANKNGNLVAFGNPDGSLAGASQEVKALSDIFPGSKVYLEGQATEDKLKSVQAPAVSYLHLATHGTLNPQEPRASYLTMAKGGKLSVGDISGFSLDTAQGDLNLVTLSACQTNLAGKQGADGSDLRSLASAFSFAGCRSMVASLWKVEDNATRDLMIAFYKNLKAGQSKARALQGAQISLLHQEKYSHPFYWAPFVLIGDWR